MYRISTPPDPPEPPKKPEPVMEYCIHCNRAFEQHATWPAHFKAQMVSRLFWVLFWVFCFLFGWWQPWK